MGLGSRLHNKSGWLEGGGSKCKTHGHTTDQQQRVRCGAQKHNRRGGDSRAMSRYKRTAVKYITERVDVRMGSSSVGSF